MAFICGVLKDHWRMINESLSLLNDALGLWHFSSKFYPQGFTQSFSPGLKFERLYLQHLPWIEIDFKVQWRQKAHGTRSISRWCLKGRFLRLSAVASRRLISIGWSNRRNTKYTLLIPCWPVNIPTLNIPISESGTNSSLTHNLAKSQSYQGLKLLQSDTKFMITCKFYAHLQ